MISGIIGVTVSRDQMHVIQNFREKNQVFSFKKNTPFFFLSLLILVIILFFNFKPEIKKTNQIKKTEPNLKNRAKLEKPNQTSLNRFLSKKPNQIEINWFEPVSIFY